MKGLRVASLVAAVLAWSGTCSGQIGVTLGCRLVAATAAEKPGKSQECSQLIFAHEVKRNAVSRGMAVGAKQKHFWYAKYSAFS